MDVPRLRALQLSTHPKTAFAPTCSPLEGALFLSRLKGEATPFIARLQEAYAQGVDAQVACLQAIAAENPNNTEPVVGAASYFRDRLLETPGPQTAGQLRALCDRLSPFDAKSARTLFDVSAAYLA